MLPTYSRPVLGINPVFHSCRGARNVSRKPRCQSGEQEVDPEHNEQLEETTSCPTNPPEPQQLAHVVRSAALAPIQSIQYPSWHGSSENLITAGAIVLAAKLGQYFTERHRLSLYGTDRTSGDGIMNISRDLALRRKKQLEIEAQSKEQETKQRMQEALLKAKEQEAKRQEREKRYQAEKEMELKRLEAEKQHQRKAFEEQERKMKNELQRRKEIEMSIQKEMEEKRRAEAEAKKRQEDEERRKELERQAAEKAEQQRQEEVERQKQKAEKEALERLKTKFAVRLEGEILVKRSPSGVQTLSPPRQQSLLSIHLKLKPSISEQHTSLEDHFASIQDAQESIGNFIGVVCHEALNGYLTDVRIQSMTGTGPLKMMDDPELQLFTALASLHAHFVTEKIALGLIYDFDDSGSISSIQKKIEVRTEWGVLPQGNEKRLDSRMTSIFKQMEVMEVKTKPQIEQLILEWIHAEKESFYTKHKIERHLQECFEGCYVSYIHDQALATKDAVLYESLVMILEEILKVSCQEAKLDTLQNQSIALSAAIGKEHPIIEWFSCFSQQNMSAEKREQAIEKQRRIDAIAKAKLLEEQWPDRQQISTKIQKEREDETPIPERVWAMRNVSRTLLMHPNPSSSALNQAEDLITKALKLQEEHFSSLAHPGLLGSLKDYADIEMRIDLEKAQLAWERIVEILAAVCDQYRRQGELFSAALCAETAILSAESYLDVGHPTMRKLSKISETLFNGLNGQEQAKFIDIRRRGNAFSKIVECFAVQLDAYKKPGKKDRLEQWTKNEDLDPL